MALITCSNQLDDWQMRSAALNIMGGANDRGADYLYLDAVPTALLAAGYGWQEVFTIKKT